MARARLSIRMVESRTLLSELIETQPAFKLRKHTFLKTTRVWLKSRRIGSVTKVVSATKEIAEKREALLLRRDESIIGRLAKDMNLGSGKHIRRLEFTRKCTYVDYILSSDYALVL
ncbi:hypothetical protein EDEG_02532 [Edhazardia aedis USNM 41457]|uniref:Uncharacterized protein n=1 Tax=Edhazardia aedis (strain USNM 41457) TaxID=1003232 RepID=J9D6F5_EDHAE|nr:hypothetical protein EDEG_02532 [Edhazardia aedis USNM 41457]|eukprot:EJW03089.1 hypothetical protein EDEG_02532 [Edhazardia aedis USNM 41457]